MRIATPAFSLPMRNTRLPKHTVLAIFLLIAGGGLVLLSLRTSPIATSTAFDGQRAYQDIAYQVSLGPRPSGSQAHAQTTEWLVETLQAADWQAEVQRAEVMGQMVSNVVATRGKGTPWILLGAHYDTRMFADRDPDPAKRKEPVMGANDGASGVAVLLELARVLPRELDMRISLVFFDAEDNGNIPGWDWVLGSRAYVAELENQPDAVVIVDMIGDADLNIFLEMNSDPSLSEEIWDQAAALGYTEEFIPSPKYAILDDHTPFLEVGIPAIDIIDFDYPYWHTTKDTLDKVSPHSLQAVGDTLLAWLLTQ